MSKQLLRIGFTLILLVILGLTSQIKEGHSIFAQDQPTSVATPTPVVFPTITPLPATPTPVMFPTVTPLPPAPTAEPTDMGRVTICHKGKKTMSLPPSAVPAHLGHGDSLGPCAEAQTTGFQFAAYKMFQPSTATFTPAAPTATATRTATRTATNTPTSVAPTATFTPVAPTATFTPAAPTATFTPVAPTATFTPAAPTATATPQALIITYNASQIVGYEFTQSIYLQSSLAVSGFGFDLHIPTAGGCLLVGTIDVAQGDASSVIQLNAVTWRILGFGATLIDTGDPIVDVSLTSTAACGSTATVEIDNPQSSSPTAVALTTDSQDATITFLNSLPVAVDDYYLFDLSQSTTFETTPASNDYDDDGHTVTLQSIAPSSLVTHVNQSALWFFGIDQQEMGSVGYTVSDGFETASADMHYAAGLRFDCNADMSVFSGRADVADVVAHALELVDGDNQDGSVQGLFTTYQGTYPGNPVGCNSQNADHLINVADLSCAVRGFNFGTSDLCAAVSAARSDPPMIGAVNGGLIYAANDSGVNALYFRLVGTEEVTWTLPSGFQQISQTNLTGTVDVAIFGLSGDPLPSGLLGETGECVLSFEGAEFGTVAGTTVAGETSNATGCVNLKMFLPLVTR